MQPYSVHRHDLDTPVSPTLLDRVRGEYREMPGLSLTTPQAARLWGLSTRVCATVLDALAAEGDLIRTRDGRHVATTRLTTVQRRGRGDGGTYQ